MQWRAIKTETERARYWMNGLDITRWRFNVALCLTVLLDMDAASAAAWCLRRGRWLSRPHGPQTLREALLQQALEQAVLAAPVAYCASWTDPDVAALGMTALRAATKASRDKRLRDWVAERNAVHGAAVASASIVNQCNAESDTFPAVGAPMADIGVPEGEVSQRSWCYRWRHRCDGKFSSLRTKEPVPLPTKRDKDWTGYFVFSFFKEKTEFWGTAFKPFF